MNSVIRRSLLLLISFGVGICSAQQSPDYFNVTVSTTVSETPINIAVTRAWSPNGADQFWTLLKNRYYDQNGFFRVVPGFVVQFGISGNTTISAQWKNSVIPDDPVVKSNLRGYMTFATAGPNTRTTQLFINYADNSRLDSDGFSPFAVVTSGMEVVDAIYSGYEQKPQQPLIYQFGNAYLEKQFPKLDYIVSMDIEM